MNKKMKLLLLSCVLFVVLYLSFKLPAEEKKEIEKTGEKAIGTLSHHGLKTMDISYNYKGRHFTYIQSVPYSNLVEGEQYEITISQNDPARIYVHMDRPYLDTNAYK